MSRNQATRRIWRTLKRHVGEARSEQVLLTRRQMLKISAVASGGLFLKPRSLFAQRSTTGGTPRVGIVGAGIAGLTAALTLQDAGIPSTIFESSNRLGGRMHSNHTFWKDNQTSEWCGEFIDSDHRVIRGLARRFALKLEDVVAAEPSDSVDTNYFKGGYYTDADFARDFKKIAPILAEQNRRIGNTVLYNQYNAAGYHFDHLSLYDWIETYVPGGHGSRLGQYLDIAYVTEDGLDSGQQSSLNLIFPLDSDERYHIKNGNQQLPNRISQTLTPGTIQRGWRMTAIADSDPTVTLTLDTPSGTQSAEFDYVILALPFSVLRHLDYQDANFDALKQIAIAQLGYGTNSKLILQFNQRYWNGRGSWPGIGDGFIETDLPFQSTWDSSRAEPGLDGLLTDYTGGKNGAAYRPSGPYTTSQSSPLTANYAEEFLAQLEIVWPGVSVHYEGRAALSYPTGDPNLRGSYSTYKVGQYTQFAGYEPVPQGRIYFAGEHCSYNFQGYMEGGAETGQSAAKAILVAIA
jgi:monoamine oxidase